MQPFAEWKKITLSAVSFFSSLLHFLLLTPPSFPSLCLFTLTSDRWWEREREISDRASMGGHTRRRVERQKKNWTQQTHFDIQICLRVTQTFPVHTPNALRNVCVWTSVMANFTIHGETSATKEDSGLNEVSLIESFDGNCLGFFLHFYIDETFTKWTIYFMCWKKQMNLQFP